MLPVNCAIKITFLLCFGLKVDLYSCGEDVSSSTGLQLVLNYKNGETEIHVGGNKWFENTDVIVHQNHTKVSQNNGGLLMSSSGPISIDGTDIIGDYNGMDIDWNSHSDSRNQSKILPYTDEFLTTRARSYGIDVIVFSQIFSSGLLNSSLGSGSASINKVSYIYRFSNRLIFVFYSFGMENLFQVTFFPKISTVYPSLNPRTKEKISYMSYGGFMGGWAAASVGPLTSEYKGPTRVRDGEYGGPLVLFDENFQNVLIISSINNFMISSILRNDKVSSDILIIIQG